MVEPASMEQSAHDRGEVTTLLARWRAGDDTARDRLFERIYPQLKGLAAAHLRRSPGHLTLGVTDLTHEAYMKLIELYGLDWKDRRHFLAVAARVTRYLVIDLLRRKGAAKRGGGLPFAELTDWNSPSVPVDGTVDWIGVDEALTELEVHHERSARIVELKFFSGLTVNEIADTLECSPATVKRSWRFARSWLADRLGRPSA